MSPTIHLRVREGEDREQYQNEDRGERGTVFSCSTTLLESWRYQAKQINCWGECILREDGTASQAHRGLLLYPIIEAFGYQNLCILIVRGCDTWN